MDNHADKNGTSKAAIEDWDDYFLAIAKMVSLKSKDESRVGAVIVSPDKLVVSTGYNGPPRGVFDSAKLFYKNPSNGNGQQSIAEKLRWICHAEQNAILNAVRLGVSVKGCTIYVNKFPCLACLISMVQAGIECAYTHDIDFWDGDPLDGKDNNDQSDKEPHWRKRELINQINLIRAPFHKDYQFYFDSEYLSWKRIYEDFVEQSGEVKKDDEKVQELKSRSNKDSKRETRSPPPSTRKQRKHNGDGMAV